MNIIITGGFLGAGKTSIILQMARYLSEVSAGHNTSSVVILENEIGEVSIDDKILQTGGFTVETMFSGCVCCTMAGELIPAIQNIADQLHPEWIIMEATGVAYPLKIRENLEQAFSPDSCRIFCVTDAKRWKRLEKALNTFIQDQLDSANVIFVNKIDAVSKSEVKEVLNSVKRFNPEAECYCVSASKGIGPDVWQKIFTVKNVR